MFLWNFTEDDSFRLLYHGAKKSKMTKNSNHGGPAFNSVFHIESNSKTFFFISWIKIRIVLRVFVCFILNDANARQMMRTDENLQSKTKKQ